MNQPVRFGAVNTFRFKLPDFDTLPDHLKEMGPDAAAKAVKTQVLGEAVYELYRYADRFSQTIPSELDLSEKIRAGHLEPEDVVVLSNDHKGLSEADRTVGGNDAFLYDVQQEALFRQYRPMDWGRLLRIRDGAERAEAHQNQNEWIEAVEKLQQEYRDRAEVTDINVQSVFNFVDHDPPSRLRVGFEIPSLGYKSVWWRDESAKQ